MSTHVDNQNLKPDGIAKITFEGDQITWNAEDDKQKTIQLVGSHFKDVIPVATLAFSALYGVAFVVILWEYLRRRGPKKAEMNKKGKMKYAWSAGTAMLCMILFYAIDLFNRVEHERERIEKSYYIAIDIPLGVFPSLADGLLLVYLMRRGPVKITTTQDSSGGSKLAKWIMYIAFILYWFIGICTKGAQIWNVVHQFTPPDAQQNCVKNNDCSYLHWAAFSLQIEQDLASAASGMLLLFSIGYGIFSIWYLRDPPDDGPLQRRLSRIVLALATFFLSRNIVNFAFTLLYAQFGHSANLVIQLVYVALWGFLTVAVYIAVVCIEATKKLEGMVLINTNSQQQQSFDEYASVPRTWPQEKPQVNVGTSAQQNFDTYPGVPRSWPQEKPQVNVGSYQYSRLQTDDEAHQYPSPQGNAGGHQYFNENTYGHQEFQQRYHP